MGWDCDDLPELLEALGAGRVPTGGRKSNGLGSATTRGALRPRGLPWVPGGDKASAKRRSAGSGEPGLAGHMSFAPGGESKRHRRDAERGLGGATVQERASRTERAATQVIGLRAALPFLSASLGRRAGAVSGLSRAQA